MAVRSLHMGLAGRNIEPDSSNAISTGVYSYYFGSNS
jgi:hypothetical protein